MSYPDFGFEQFNRERRKFAGRRVGTDRRAIPDRRTEQRRLETIPVMSNRRSGTERRSGDERRKGERRSLEDRRNSAWRLLAGG
ncbi:MAG: hypothetical protein HYW52_03565 [Gemmatimonadetes bacterium]|nr:hypothetical protein [Gemmatimonadota bacterium]MBI2401922.1 hypothetical protein [Gemmatimonadota bacterium]MBI2614757.1 hypothetical protein [Gemmatimonadota bacterium]MBI3081762.1 hypothetical protein [Gemmatimonadota bacterium]